MSPSRSTASGATTSTIASIIGVTGNNNTMTVEGGSTLNITGGIKNSDWYQNGTTPGGFIKAGSGTMTLSNANIYTGATSVNEGTLKVTGSIESSAVTVNNSGTVLSSGTTGTIGKGVTVNSGAILAAGGKNAVGTATVGSDGLSFASGSIFDWDLNANSTASGFDTVSTTGTLTIGSGAIFNIVLGSGVTADPFWTNPAVTRTWTNIFNYGSLVGSFADANINVSGPGAPNTGMGSFTISGTTLTWTAVPEPTSALAGLLITAGLLRRRRKF